MDKDVKVTTYEAFASNLRTRTLADVRDVDLSLQCRHNFLRDLCKKQAFLNIFGIEATR